MRVIRVPPESGSSTVRYALSIQQAIHSLKFGVEIPDCLLLGTDFCCVVVALLLMALSFRDLSGEVG